MRADRPVEAPAASKPRHVKLLRQRRIPVPAVQREVNVVPLVQLKDQFEVLAAVVAVTLEAVQANQSRALRRIDNQLHPLAPFLVAE